MSVVYVQDMNGRPLPPTKRCGHVRTLLKEKKAIVANRKPFTIRLLKEVRYENEQQFLLGIDPGRTNIGTGVVNNKGDTMFLCNTETRNKEIPALMAARKEYRRKHRDFGRRDVRQRRARKHGTTVHTENQVLERKLPGCDKPIQCHLIKNKKARFLNRKRPKGWLTPTARQLLETHLSLIRKLRKLLPVTDIVIELNQFAFMALDNPKIQKWEFQKGRLFKKDSVEEAIKEQQHGQCLLCTQEIQHYHHIVPKSQGGSNTLPNIAGLCERHHRLVHTDEQWKMRLASSKEGQNKKYGALSVLNQIIPYLVEEAEKLYPGHVFVTTGQDTKRFREYYGIEKDHCLDACCIAMSVLNQDNLQDIAVGMKEAEMFHIRQFRRNDRQVCHQENTDRKYLDRSHQVVAINRHKRMEQTKPSLEEYRMSNTDKEVSKLVVKPHKPTQKRLNRWMPASVLREGKQSYVLVRSFGTYKGQPNYYIDQHGNRHSAKKSKLLIANSGLVFL